MASLKNRRQLADFLSENKSLPAAAGKDLDIYVVASVQGFADLAPGNNRRLSEERAKTAGQGVAKNMGDAGKDVIKIYPCSGGHGAKLPLYYVPSSQPLKTLSDPNRRVAQTG
jgi:hypothetical protein